MSEHTIIVILTVLLGLLQLGDWYTTRTVLKAGGTEDNKFTAFVLRFINLDVYLAGKAALAFYVGYHIGFISMPFLVFLTTLYGFYMVRNWKQL